ncbi:ABC1-domain-containing protein [Neurospora tetraspora]|uniref:ABC1-domain-containing protein n=1 Tax=Neurospora tetraspora TaxID=94610 RepID=A0AAE0JCC7_9PEZI|nr:ABC1-domain-containing protein [Neurospora tetraspora]
MPAMRLAAVAVGRLSCRAQPPPSLSTATSRFSGLLSHHLLRTSSKQSIHASSSPFPTATRSIPRAPRPRLSQTWQKTGGEGGKGGAGYGRYYRPRVSLWAKAANGALATAAFVSLSEEDNNGTEQTFEQRMLQVSREEIEKKVGEDVTGLKRIVKKIVLFLDLYIWEPLWTGIRFLELVAIFVPVIITVPAIWFGERQPDRDNERSGTLWWYGFLVQAMEWAGPAFIKLGQWAASRSDIFPDEMCNIMSKLHADAPAHSLHATKRIVEEAFGGRHFDEIFEEFDEKPMGVGAIAQVYRAKLNPDLHVPADADLSNSTHRFAKKVGSVLKATPKRVPSSYVAIKVLHPGVERTVRRDLRIMGFFASMINAIPTLEWLSLPDEVQQFGEMMQLQLDLRIEAANLSRFRKNFKDRTTAWFPYPYTKFSTRNVLVEEFAHGIPLADFMANGGGVFQQEIASEGLDAFLRMLLLDNFVHADLHPGNIMVRFYESEKPTLSLHWDKPSDAHPKTAGGKKNGDVTEHVLSRLRPYKGNKELWTAELEKIDKEGYRPQLIFIDTGLVTELNATNRRNFLDLFRAVAEFDGYKAGHLMCERCRQPDMVLDKEVFALKMQHLVLGVANKTLALGNIKIGDILQDVLNMVRQHHVRLEGDYVNVVISILLLEGIGRSLDPDVDLLSSSLPILRQLGAHGGKDMLMEGDVHMMVVWLGLEARRFMQASIEDVERCVKYDLLAPNV